MSSASNIVYQAFVKAEDYAKSAQYQLSTFAKALDSAIYTPPKVSLEWETPAAPGVPPSPRPARGSACTSCRCSRQSSLWGS